jgi:hypothetical protein
MFFPRTRSCSRLLTGVVAVLAVFLTGTSASASEELRKVLRELAVKLKTEIKNALRGERAEVGPIAIGQFTGPPNFPTSSGSGIAELLTEELQKEGVVVKLVARFGVKGEFTLAPTDEERPATDPAEARIGKKVLTIMLTASLVDDTKPVGNFNFTRFLRGEDTKLELIPVPVALPPKGTELERDQELRKARQAPKSDIQGSVVRSNADSPYAIEILVGGEIVQRAGKAPELEGAEAREAEDKQKVGLAFVTIKRDEVYAVRLINDSNLEAAVQLRIDGLSMFAFSERRQPEKDAKGKGNPRKGEPLYTVVIVAPRSKAVIPGWHVNNEKSDRFLVTEFAKSAAALLEPKGGIGTISATFQAAWDKNTDPPADEPGKKRGPGAGDATGRGPRIEQKYEEVQRELGVIRDAISVRYKREVGK